MTEVEQYDFRNITYQVAKEFARINVDAFRDDMILKALIDKDARMDDASLPPLIEYEKLKARVELFEKVVESSARERFLAIRSDPRQRLYLLRDPSQGVYVAGSSWSLPKYLDLPKIPLLLRIRNWFLARWYQLREFIAFYPKKNPFATSGITEEFAYAAEMMGGEVTPERMEELHSMDLKQLKETSYPKDLSYYLFLLCVRRDTHGKGYGKKMVHGALKHMEPFRGPPELVGPAKTVLFSAPTAKGFYIKLGFEIGASMEHQLRTGDFAPHVYFFHNLPTQR